MEQAPKLEFKEDTQSVRTAAPHVSLLSTCIKTNLHNNNYIHVLSFPRARSDIHVLKKKNERITKYNNDISVYIFRLH
jgi:hypothetical protein